MSEVRKEKWFKRRVYSKVKGYKVAYYKEIVVINQPAFYKKDSTHLRRKTLKEYRRVEGVAVSVKKDFDKWTVLKATAIRSVLVETSRKKGVSEEIMAWREVAKTHTEEEARKLAKAVLKYASG